MTNQSNRRQVRAARDSDPAGSNADRLLETALDFARRGLPVFPCNPSNKAPLLPNGFKGASTDEAKICNWWHDWPNAMIGMPTGRASGIVVLDIDLKPEEFIDGFQYLPGYEKLSPIIVRTPSGGAHVWFKSTDDKVRNSTDQIAPGIDTRGDGGYAIVPPSRNRAGGKYSFIKGGLDDIDRLPAFPPELFDKLGPKHEGRGSADPEADPKVVCAAMEAVPNPDLGYDDWKKFGMAIWGATSGSEDGLAIFDEWSQKSTKYDANNTRRAWQEITRSPPSRIGAGTIIYHANEADPGWRQSAVGAVAVLRTSTPVESASEFVRHGYECDGAPGLIYYRDSFYEWTGTHYEECDDVHLRSKVYEFLHNAVTPEGAPFNPTAHKVNSVIDALESLVEQNSRRDTPFWLGGCRPRCGWNSAWRDLR